MLACIVEGRLQTANAPPAYAPGSTTRYAPDLPDRLGPRPLIRLSSSMTSTVSSPLTLRDRSSVTVSLISSRSRTSGGGLLVSVRRVSCRMILSDRSRLGAGLRLGCLVLLVLALMLLISLLSLRCCLRSFRRGFRRGSCRLVTTTSDASPSIY